LHSQTIDIPETIGFRAYLPPDWYTTVVHTVLAMTHPYEHPNTGIYWFRKRVPDALRELVGKQEEKFSLRTCNPSEAKVRLAKALAEVDQRWHNLSLGSGRID